MENIVFKYGGFAVNLVLRFDYIFYIHLVSILKVCWLTEGC